VLRPLFLQSHVFLCQAKRHWVILDANRDKYLCVDRHQFETLGRSLKGWDESPLGTSPARTSLRLQSPLPAGDVTGTAAPVPRLQSPPGTSPLPRFQSSAPGARSPAELPEDVGALASDLLRRDILSESAAQAKDARPTVYRLPTEAVDPDLHSRHSPWAHAVAFFASSARASRELSKQRFQLTVESVRARKSGNAHRVGQFDFERARLLVAVFDRLRLFYPRSYLCLFDSLALIHFLARFRLYPDWVFGVNADPFEAHCWVQAGSVVLNDTLGRVSSFTPIMSV
jgi:hypothetical protein